MGKQSLIFLILVTVLLTTAVSQSDAAEKSKADSLLQAKKHFSFAVQYKKSESFNQALENYKLSISLNDTVYQVHYSFADLLLDMNRPLDARREFLITLTLNPAHYKSSSMLARLYYEAAEYDSALVMYETMYCLQPCEKKLLSSIAGLRDYLGKKNEALEAYTELINSGEDSYENLMKAVSLSVLLEDMEQAGNLISLALEKHPGDRQTLETASHIYLEQNDMVSASRYLRQLAEIDSTDFSVIEKLEKIYRLGDDTTNLIWILKRQYSLSPEDSVLVGELVELLFGEGEINQGLTYLKKGLERSPGDGKLHILMGNYYRGQEETEKALKEYRTALNDEKWRSRARQFIWQINPPQTEAEKAEQEFFRRGQESQKKRNNVQ